MNTDQDIGCAFQLDYHPVNGDIVDAAVVSLLELHSCVGARRLFQANDH